MNVVVFTGGNGNANLIKHLKGLSYVKLSLLINGYDDGLSTGVIRSANQGMLGPSDYRKNFTYILDDFTDYNRNLKKLFEHRLSEEETRILLHNPVSLIKKLIQENYYKILTSIIYIEQDVAQPINKLKEIIFFIILIVCEFQM